MMLAGFWADWGLIVAFVSISIIYMVICLRKGSKIESIGMRFWRRYLPELDLLPSHAARRLALSLATNNWQTNLIGVPLAVAALVAVNWLLPIFYSVFPLVRPIESILNGCTFGAIIFSGIWLTRTRIRRRLREELIENGFAICRPCGYDSRGLPESRCPECGAPFDKRLLSNSTLQTEDG